MAASDLSTLQGADELGGFLRLHRARVLAEWQRETCGERRHSEATCGECVDAEALLDGIAALAEAESPGQSSGVGRAPLDALALRGLSTNWDLRRVLRALSTLRDCVVRLWSHDGAAGRWQDGVRLLHTTIDRVIQALVERHVKGSQTDDATLVLERAEMEGRFRATFDSVPLAIAHVATDGTWLHLNQGFCKLLGYSCDELRGLKLHDLTHPDDVAAEKECLSTLLTSAIGASVKVEKRCRRKDGAFIWVDATVSVVQDRSGQADYFVVAMADVSAELQLRKQLRFLADAGALLGSTLEYRRTLEDVVNLMVPDLADWCALELLSADNGRPECVAVAHRDPARVELAKKMRRLYPPRFEDDGGVARVLRTGEPELISDIQGALSSLDEGGRALVETLGLRSALICPLMNEHRVIGALCLANAESGRLFTAEDMRFAQEVALRAAIAIANARLHDELSRAVEARDQVLGIVSHDLRNPLNTIELGSGMLLKNATLLADAAANKQLQMIRRSARRATRLITDLLDMSGIQAGKLALSIAPCDLTALVTEAVEMQEPMARERGISLRSDSDLDGQPVSCDRDRILQVLSNLVGNALKFCAPGDSISVRAHGEPDAVVLSVSDTGPGIAPEALEHVFELYWKGSEATRGSGLGLFISKGIIEAHGGRIRLHSQVGAGTTFELVLPRVLPPQLVHPG